MRGTKMMAMSLSLSMLAGCASVIEGSTDQMNVVTNPPMNASCTFTNSRRVVTSAVPSTVSIKKSKSDINVVCNAPGATGEKLVESDIEPWVFGNVLIGGLVGLIVDWSTGATYDYPEQMTIPMTAVYTPVPVVDPSAMPLTQTPVEAPTAAPYPYAAPAAVPAAEPYPYAAPVQAPVAVPYPYNTPAAPAAAPVAEPAYTAPAPAAAPVSVYPYNIPTAPTAAPASAPFSPASPPLQNAAPTYQ